MLSVEENERLCRVGAGTPMGELMRRYWHPVSTVAQLKEKWVRKVRILGEDLVLFRDRAGKLGLVNDKCPHRGMSMEFCIPEQEGVRCAYHGWQFAASGRCLDTPLEPSTSRLKDKVSIKAYPVQELGGLIWAYMGPEPAPLLPRWELLVQKDTFRQIRGTILPCNWLQVMENRLDPLHTVYLHGYRHQWALEQKGILDSVPNDGERGEHRGAFICARDNTKKLIFERWDYGFTKFAEKHNGEVDPRGTIIFPYMLYHGGPGLIRQEFQLGVPIDDTTTWHIYYNGVVPGHGVTIPKQDVVGYFEVPLQDPNGEYIMDCILQQDLLAWVSQGDIADRSVERLGTTDIGITKYRRFLQEQMERVQNGVEPICIFRNHEDIEPLIRVPYTSRRNNGLQPKPQRENASPEDYVPQELMRYATDPEMVIDLYKKARAAALQGVPWGEMPSGAVDR